MKKASIFLWLFLIGSHPVWAETIATKLGEQADSSLDARKKANQYSFDTGGIGIFISYGKKNGVSAQTVSEAFVNEIKRRGFKARYFFCNTDQEGMAMEFYIGYSAMGPWNVDHAASQVSKVVTLARAAHNIHRR